MALQLSKEFRVGAFSIIALVTFFFGYNYLKGTDFFNSSKRYYLVFNDVSGITSNSYVMFKGVKVGQVADLEFITGDTAKVKVTVTIQDRVRIPKNAYAELEGGLIGDKSIKLIIPDTKSNEYLESGNYISTQKPDELFDKITKQATPILTKTDSLLAKVNRMVDSKMDSSIHIILKNLELTTSGLNQMIRSADPKLQSALGNVSDITASLAQTEKKLKPILEKMNGIADSLQKAKIAQTVSNANKSIAELHQVIEKINKGEGSLGKLVNSDSLHTNLNKTVKDLDKLFIDMQEHPKRYVHFSVFGRKEK